MVGPVLQGLEARCRRSDPMDGRNEAAGVSVGLTRMSSITPER